MATTLKTIITAEISTIFKNLLDLSSPTDTLLKKLRFELTNGTAANMADLCFHDQRSLAASATEDLDLSGTLAGPFGASQVFVELRGILVLAAASNTNNVNVIRPAANGVPLFLAAGDGVPVGPGGVFLWACPADGKVAIAAGTGDLLTFTNSAGSTTVTYDVVLIGVSA